MNDIKEKNNFFKNIKNNIIEKTKTTYGKIKISLISIAIGFLLGFIVMLLINPVESFAGLGLILSGGFFDGLNGIGKELHKAAPIILTGLAFAFAYKAGLFNIGMPGQMAVGAFIAVYVGVKVNLPAPFHWLLGLTLGTLGGAIWGSISGFLKARFNVNEVVSSIMLNYVAMYGLSLGVQTLVPDPVHLTQSQKISESATLPDFGLRAIFGGNYITIAIIIAILAAILCNFIINKTKKGYEIKTAGFSIDASNYAGMKTKFNLFLAMLISGAFAGLAGAILYSETGVHLETLPKLFKEGYDGISVALLGLGEPIGVIFAGLFLSHLHEGSFNIDLTSFNAEIAQVIVAVIIYSISLSSGIFLILNKIEENKNRKLKENSNLEIKENIVKLNNELNLIKKNKSANNKKKISNLKSLINLNKKLLIYNEKKLDVQVKLEKEREKNSNFTLNTLEMDKNIANTVDKINERKNEFSKFKNIKIIEKPFKVENKALNKMCEKLGFYLIKKESFAAKKNSEEVSKYESLIKDITSKISDKKKILKTAELFLEDAKKYYELHDELKNIKLNIKKNTKQKEKGKIKVTKLSNKNDKLDKAIMKFKNEIKKEELI